MSSDLDSDEESPTELRRRRVFRIQMWAGAACYLFASFALRAWAPDSGPWRVITAVLPLFFAVWALVVVVLRVRRMDEYQRKLYFPGLAVGFSVTIFAALAVASLGSAGIFVPAAGWLIAIAGLLGWTVTNILVKAPLA